jgi:hypothetical protein
MLGIGDALRDGQPAVAQFGSLERASQEFESLKQSWHPRLGSLR